MCGVIFTVLGGFLAYVAFWVISERLADDRLGREGTPVGIIFIILLGVMLCLGGGLSSLLGKRWLIRFLLSVTTGLAGRSLKSR